MKKEIKSIVKKTAKIAGVTCIVAGAVALMTSATAIKALTEGGKYLKDTVQKILKEEPKIENPVVEESEESPTGGPVAEAVVLEENNTTI